MKEQALQWAHVQGTPDPASQADGCDPAGVPGHQVSLSDPVWAAETPERQWGKTMPANLVERQPPPEVWVEGAVQHFPSDPSLSMPSFSWEDAGSHLTPR